MKTAIIKNRSEAAKQLIEFLKTQSYAEVIEDEDLNDLHAKDVKTVINIKSSSKAAKRMLEYLKTQHYIKIYDKDKPNAATLRAIEEAKTDKTTIYNNAEKLIAELHKISNV